MKRLKEIILLLTIFMLLKNSHASEIYSTGDFVYYAQYYLSLVIILII